mgnify:FL=1
MHEDLEWDIRVPLVSNVFVVVDVLVIFLLLSVGLAGLVLFLTGVSVYRVFRVFLIADGILIVLLFGVIGYVFTNRFMLKYRIDDEGVLVQVGKFTNQVNRAAWRISSFIQQHGFHGERVFTLGDESLFVPWGRVTRVVVDERRNVATLTDSVRPLMRIYCTSGNFDMVFDKLRSHIPELIE